jgi:hypothetical protein
MLLPSTPRAPQAAATSDPTLARAHAYARRARAAAQRIGDEHFRGFLDGLLGEVLLLQGQVDEAWPIVERALCQAQAHGHASLAAAVSQTERATMHGAQSERLQRALAGWRGAASAAPTNRGAGRYPTRQSRRTAARRCHRRCCRRDQQSRA